MFGAGDQLDNAERELDDAADELARLRGIVAAADAVAEQAKALVASIHYGERGFVDSATIKTVEAPAAYDKAKRGAMETA